MPKGIKKTAERVIASGEIGKIPLRDYGSEIDLIATNVNKLNNTIDSLAGMMEQMLRVEKISDEARVVMPPKAPDAMLGSTEISSMFPRAWRSKINEILGEDFVAKVEDSNGNFILHVIMPEGYDRRVGYHEGIDSSTGLIRRATDIADVTTWCERIKSNLFKELPDIAKKRWGTK